MEQFIKLIKSTLAEKDMNVSQLARQIKVSPQYMHDLLKGESRWNETLINLVCKALKIKYKFYK